MMTLMIILPWMWPPSAPIEAVAERWALGFFTGILVGLIIGIIGIFWYHFKRRP